MAEAFICYGIKSKNGLMQVEEMNFDDLGPSEYDFQIVFKTIFNNRGNVYIELLLFQDGQEVESVELDGWKIQKLHISGNWAGTCFEAEVTDPLGVTQQFEFAGDNGPMSPYKLSYQELLRQGFNEMKRFSTFGSISMINLCEHSRISIYPTTLSDYYFMLKRISEFCQQVEEIRSRLHNNPLDKDLASYNSILKPKLIEYMEKVSKAKISLDKLNP